jgi:hypothetical protein
MSTKKVSAIGDGLSDPNTNQIRRMKKLA